MIKSVVLIIIVFVVHSISASAQELKEQDVPQIVREGVKKKYPDVYVYEWEWKKKRNVYQAEFILKGAEYEADFTKEGIWVKTERDISSSDVPLVVWEHFNQTEYTTWKIEDMEEHSTPKYKRVYAFEVSLTKNKILLYFLPTGTLVETFTQ